MHAKYTETASHPFNSTPQESQLRGQPKTDGGNVYKQILIDAKWKTGKRG
jgi:hypothetical protein